MTQTYADLTTPESGTQLVTDYNAAKSSILSMHAGTSRPSYAVAGTLWRDTDTPSATIQTVYMYDGTDDIPWGRFDITNNVFTPYMGAAGFPTAAFLTLADDAAVADIATTLGLGTGDSPTHAGLTLSGSTFKVKGQQLQSVLLYITNTAGTIQHKVLQDEQGGGAATVWGGNFPGISSSYANSPTLSGAVGFTSGGGFNNTWFFFNVAVQTVADLVMWGEIVFNDSGTALNVILVDRSFDANGTTRRRAPGVKFTNATSGVDYAPTTSLGSGKTIVVKLTCFVA